MHHSVDLDYKPLDLLNLNANNVTYITGYRVISLEYWSYYMSMVAQSKRLGALPCVSNHLYDLHLLSPSRWLPTGFCILSAVAWA